MAEVAAIAHQLLSNAKWSSLKHTSNIICTQQIIFRNMYAYVNAFMHILTIDEDISMNLKNKEGIHEGFGGKKRKEGREKCRM